MNLYYSVKKIDGQASADDLIKNLPDSIKSHILKYTAENAKIQSAAAWNLLAALAENAFGASLEGVDFSEDKPTIRGFYIGISHTHGLAVAAVAGENFGVDFERIDVKRDVSKLKKFLNIKANSVSEVFIDWCRREAAVKFYGKVKKDFVGLNFVSGVQEVFGEEYAFAFSSESDMNLIKI